MSGCVHILIYPCQVVHNHLLVPKNDVLCTGTLLNVDDYRPTWLFLERFVYGDIEAIKRR